MNNFARCEEIATYFEERGWEVGRDCDGEPVELAHPEGGCSIELDRWGYPSASFEFDAAMGMIKYSIFGVSLTPENLYRAYTGLPNRLGKICEEVMGVKTDE